MTLEALFAVCTNITHIITAIILNAGAFVTTQHYHSDVAVDELCFIDCDISVSHDCNHKPTYLISFSTRGAYFTSCYDFSADTLESDTHDLFCSIAKCCYDTIATKIMGKISNISLEDLDKLFAMDTSLPLFAAHYDVVSP